VKINVKLLVVSKKYLMQEHKGNRRHVKNSPIEYLFFIHMICSDVGHPPLPSAVYLREQLCHNLERIGFKH